MLQNCRRREIFCISRYQSFSRRSYISHSDEAYAGLTLFAKKVAKAIEKAIPCKRVGVAVMGLEVPHTHIHLIPINKETDMYFSKEKLKVSSEKMEKIAASIASKIK